MPVIQSNGCPIHVVVEGSENAPVLLLSNSLGTTHRMWDEQVKPFTQHFRLVRFDRRGHGESGKPKGPYSMEMLARDALAVMDGLGVKKFHWCGLSMGGMEGMWLGANAADRVDRLILSNTTSYFADKSVWAERIKGLRANGLAPLAGPTMERWFTKDFRERDPPAIKRMTEMFLASSLEGYIGCAEAIQAMDHRDLLPKINRPTLVIAGRHDPATTVEMGEFIRSRIPGASMTVLDAAHIANVEQPHDYADAVLGFLHQR